MDGDLPERSSEPAAGLLAPFWLSHQRRENGHKCVRVAGVPVCARCLGTYPALALMLIFELHRPFAAPRWAADPLLLWCLPLPAIVDWSAGQLSRWPGSNALRCFTGALLGMALGRSVYLNMRHPGDPRVLAQLIGLCAVAGIVWGIGQVLRYDHRAGE